MLTIIYFVHSNTDTSPCLLGWPSCHATDRDPTCLWQGWADYATTDHSRDAITVSDENVATEIIHISLDKAQKLFPKRCTTPPPSEKNRWSHSTKIPMVLFFLHHWILQRISLIWERRLIKLCLFHWNKCFSRFLESILFLMIFYFYWKHSVFCMIFR